MSDLILTGLLSDSTSAYSSAASAGLNRLKGLISSPAQESVSNSGAKTLSRLDSLTFSNTLSGPKGSVPINLMNPAEVTGTKGYTGKSSGGSTISRLASLTGNNKSEKPIPKNTVLKPLADLESTSAGSKTSFVSTYGTNPGTTGKISGSIVANFDFIESNDPVEAKLGIAIEKIKDWERKVKTLDAVLEAEKKIKKSPDALVHSSRTLEVARKEAMDARLEASNAYKAALEEVNGKRLEHKGFDSLTVLRKYGDAYNQMESMFASTEKKDKTIREKVKDFLAKTYNVTVEYGGVVAEYMNPLNYK